MTSAEANASASPIHGDGILRTISSDGPPPPSGASSNQRGQVHGIGALSRGAFLPGDDVAAPGHQVRADLVHDDINHSARDRETTPGYAMPPRMLKLA